MEACQNIDKNSEEGRVSKRRFINYGETIIMQWIFSHADVGDKLNNRDHHMTWTILLICTCYVIFAFPITILNVLGLEATWRKVQLTLFSIYWLQYCINFVIYALRSRQYRKAYWDFLTRFVSYIVMGKEEEEIEFLCWLE